MNLITAGKTREEHALTFHFTAYHKQECNATQTLLVIDDCFNGFLDDPAANSADRFLDTASKLVILKAFTKIYAMAELRELPFH